MGGSLLLPPPPNTQYTYFVIFRIPKGDGGFETATMFRREDHRVREVAPGVGGSNISEVELRIDRDRQLQRVTFPATIGDRVSR